MVFNFSHLNASMLVEVLSSSPPVEFSVLETKQWRVHGVSGYVHYLKL